MRKVALAVGLCVTSVCVWVKEARESLAGVLAVVVFVGVEVSEVERGSIFLLQSTLSEGSDHHTTAPMLSLTSLQSHPRRPTKDLIHQQKWELFRCPADTAQLHPLRCCNPRVSKGDECFWDVGGCEASTAMLVGQKRS